MSLFIGLHRLTSEGARNIRDLRENLDELKAILEKMNVKIVVSYACLGQYDFITVVEAPDDQTIFKASALLASRGNISTSTMKAMRLRDFAELAAKL